jgi:hypothetical protein
LKSLFLAGVAASLDALKRMLRPILAIQAVAILLVVLFYTVPAVRETSGKLALLSADGGVWGAALTTLIASIVLPRVFLLIVRWKGVQSRGADLAFEIGYFLFLGAEIYLFYVLQAYLFGSEASFAVVAKKVALDILVFTPLWNMPLCSLLFLWRDRAFSFSRTRQAVKDGELIPRLGVFVVGAVGFWFPMVSAIYSLPHDVQFVLFLLAQAAWTLLLLAMDRAKREPLTA